MGDSRIYHLRNRQVQARTRDHSHVELLLQEGLITEDEISDHPMRNFVECCLGGTFALPGMTVTPAKRLQPNDLLLACTDGFWAGLPDAEIAMLGSETEPLEQSLRRIAEKAVRTAGPYSDNTSAVAVRWNG
jgi:protein phosphatase